MTSKINPLKLYFYTALCLFLICVITKFLLIDTDLGARFKNFNHRLLSSDITFILSIAIFLIGQLFKIIKNLNRTRLMNSTILLNYILLMPLITVFSLTPFLMTVNPDKIGDGILSTTIVVITSLATLSFFGWIILFIITILRQVFLILTVKDNDTLNG